MTKQIYRKEQSICRLEHAFRNTLAWIALIVGCALPAFAADKPIVVGFSQIGAESGWRTANTESIKSEAAKRGVDLKFADAQQKQENQIKALRSFIAQDVDVIAFSPVVETGWEPVMREIKKAGIPVVLSDRAVKVSDDSLYVTFIGSDFVEEGRRAANWLVKATDGKAVIAELVGTPGSAPAIDRKKGFEEVIAKHPDMKIVKSQSGDFTRAKGKEVMEAFLKSPDGKTLPRFSRIMMTWPLGQSKRWRKRESSLARTFSLFPLTACVAPLRP